MVIPRQLHFGMGVLRTRWPSKRALVTLRRTYNKSKLQLAKGAGTLKYIKGNNQHNKVRNSNTKTHTELSRFSVFLVFHCPEFDLSVGVQTVARAPFVSCFFGDPQGGKHHGEGGIPGREGCCEGTKTL